jgi:hypothetical protein
MIVDTTTVGDLAALAMDCYQGRSAGPRSAPRLRRIAGIDLNRVNGFAAAAYQHLESRVTYVAFRGSELGVEQFIKDWLVADLKGIGLATIGLVEPRFVQATQACTWLKRVLDGQASRRSPRLYAVGHSLGGGLAQIAAAGLRDVPVVTFNAPGMLGWAKRAGVHVANQAMLHFRSMYDPVSKFSQHPGPAPIDVIVSDAKSEFAMHFLNRLAGTLASPAAGLATLAMGPAGMPVRAAQIAIRVGAVSVDAAVAVQNHRMEPLAEKIAGGPYGSMQVAKLLHLKPLA